MLLYYAVIFAGAWQLADWVFRLIDRIEDGPEVSGRGGGVRFGHRREGDGYGEKR